ncbi:13502_t:CDS:2 [Funneliformis geosporum]|nr:13502_t:CDS:2 [Funneliformis geosporum]
MLPTLQLLNQIGNFIQEKGKSAYYGLFLLGKEAGLRVSEAVNFNLSLKQKSNLYLIHGKKHKKRSVFIDPSQTNRFAFAHYLQRVKKELNISANIELTPHTLRRCFATYQANSGMPLPVLQKVLGHSRKIPQEPTKPIENQPQELPKLPAKINNEKILLNIQQKINVFIYKPTRNLALEKKNKLLQEKVKKLEQEKQEQKQIIINLKNDKQRLEKQLIQIQQEKDTLLKLLSADLQVQQANLSNKEQNTPELHQQLIAQIQVLTKN